MIKVIPAIDILNGQVVRLIQGDYQKGIRYYKDPVDMACMLLDAGLSRIHMVDLDGARASHIVNYRVLEKVARLDRLEIDFGGGLKSDEDLKIAFEAGAAMVTGGSIAVKDPETFLRWLDTYGAGRIILGADFRDGKIAVTGWTEKSELDLYAFIREYMTKGIEQVICTDISRDGMMEGPSFGVYTKLLQDQPTMYLIASGGVGSLEHLEKLEELGIPAVIMGRALYEGKISMKELQRFRA